MNAVSSEAQRLFKSMTYCVAGNMIEVELV